MKVIYKRNLNHTHLVLESENRYVEDYQMRMLKENDVEGLLPITGQGVDETSLYYYDISGLLSMKGMFKKSQIKNEDMKQLIYQLQMLIKRIRLYLLDVNHILLDPDYIFLDKSKFYFCYYPLQDNELCKEFHLLTEYFVDQINYSDQESVALAHKLNKASMEENYNLEQIIDLLEETPVIIEAATKIQEVHEEKNKEWGEGGGEMCHQRDKTTFNIFRRFHKKDKNELWGRWDELEMVEDDI